MNRSFKVLILIVLALLIGATAFFGYRHFIKGGDVLHVSMNVLRDFGEWYNAEIASNFPRGGFGDLVAAVFFAAVIVCVWFAVFTILFCISWISEKIRSVGGSEKKTKKSKPKTKSGKSSKTN